MFAKMLSDEAGYAVFTLVHVPLYLLLLWSLWNGSTPGVSHNAARAWDIFFIVHVVLLLLFLRHPLYEFKSWLSWTLILGAGVCGLADIALHF